MHNNMVIALLSNVENKEKRSQLAAKKDMVIALLQC